MNPNPHAQACILVVDDEQVIVSALVRLLINAGYERTIGTPDPLQAVALFTEYGPDLVLTDLTMPGMTGFELIAALRPLVPADDLLPIIVLTALGDTETKRQALASGATDFLTKPVDRVELGLRVRNLLDMRALHHQVQTENERLEEQVQCRTQQLEEARLETLQRLARACEYRDDDTGEHTQRVGHVAAHIGRGLGLDAATVHLLAQAAPLHDVGKVGIPDAILLKPAKLTDEEWTTMKGHSSIGAGILEGSGSAVLYMAERIARSHHERWSGGGYPDGLSGEAIPVEARIVAVADVFDALTHERPYKAAWPIGEALGELRRIAGSHLDPAAVSAFLICLSEILGADKIAPSAAARAFSPPQPPVAP